MRFRDFRETLIKDVDGQQAFDETATPRRISPFINKGSTKIKPELLKQISDDVIWPCYNRASRRKNGQVKSRRRIRGTLPPHPIAVINRAHQIERQQIKLIQKLDAATPLDFNEDVVI
jgi:hypothetical protein